MLDSIVARRTSATLGWLLVAGLACLNGWWWWLDRTPEAIAAIDLRLARGDQPGAEGALRSRLRSSPDDPDARMKLARILAIRGERAACAEELRRVPPWSPAKPDALFMEGQIDKQLHRGRDAVAAWSALIVSNPLHPVPDRYFHGAVRDLVGVLLLERRSREAHDALWKVYGIATADERPGILLQRIRSDLERIAHPDAAAQLRLQVEADPEDWDARRALGFEEHALNDEVAADRDIGAALRARPGDLATWRDYLKMLAERGETDAIRAALPRLPPGADDDAPLWTIRGNIRQLDGDARGTLEAYRRANQLDPNDPEVLYKLSQAEQLLGQAEAARVHRDRSRQIYRAQGDLRAAYVAVLEPLQKGEAGRPGYAESVRKLAGLCDELGWNREAEAWLREVEKP